METFFSAVKEWQTLAGTILGGLFALCVALIVASDARTRLQRSSGMVVIAILLSFRASFIHARDKIARDGGTDDEQTFGFASLVSMFSPTMPDRFGESVALLMPVDNHLAAHLSHIELFYSNMSQALARLQRDLEEARIVTKLLPRRKEEILADARAVRRAMESIFNSSACAVILIGRLVTSRWSVLHRIRLRLAPNDLEKRCNEALRAGEFDRSMPDT